ncbi:MAG: pentapeptide repeat-containing protein [Cyanobacteria bacterium P01_E01_bin.42]
MKRKILAFFAVIMMALAGFAPPAAAYSLKDLYVDLANNNACSQCDLSDANLSGANLSGAKLNGAKFCGTIMPNGSEKNDNC